MGIRCVDCNIPVATRAKHMNALYRKRPNTMKLFGKSSYQPRNITTFNKSLAYCFYFIKNDISMRILHFQIKKHDARTPSICLQNNLLFILTETNPNKQKSKDINLCFLM